MTNGIDDDKAFFERFKRWFWALLIMCMLQQWVIIKTWLPPAGLTESDKIEPKWTTCWTELSKDKP